MLCVLAEELGNWGPSRKEWEDVVFERRLSSVSRRRLSSALRRLEKEKKRASEKQPETLWEPRFWCAILSPFFDN